MPDETPTHGDAPATETPATPPAGDAPKVYDETYVKGLRAEAAGYRTTLRDREATVNALQADLTAERERVAALEPTAKTAVRYKVALEMGLTTALAERLRGDDEEALKADATALKSLLGDSAPVTLDQGRTPPPPASTPSINDALRALLGN